MQASFRGDKPQWSIMKEVSEEKNSMSLSNGSLMRNTPMCVFTSELDQKIAKDIIQAEVAFTHPNQLIKDAIFIYNITIHFLLKNIDDPDRAQKAFDLAVKRSSKMKPFYDEYSESEQSVQQWLQTAIELDQAANKSVKLIKRYLPEDILNCRNSGSSAQ